MNKKIRFSALSSGFYITAGSISLDAMITDQLSNAKILSVPFVINNGPEDQLSNAVININFYERTSNSFGFACFFLKWDR